MKKFLLALCLLLSYQAFASHMLEKHVRSGFIDPQFSFAYDCFLYANGAVVITKRNGTGAPHTVTHYVSRARRAEIGFLNQIASYGRIENLGVSCDGGDKLLYGYYKGSRFILDEDKDCAAHKINRSRATPRLKTLSRWYCGF